MELSKRDGAPTEEPSTRQFVSFRVGEVELGLPLEQVQEIIRVPDLVRVPLSPACVLGIANLRGRVLPVASLRRLLELDDLELEETMRVVVVDCGTRLGLLVDKMSSVLTAEAGDIDSAEDLRGISRSEVVEEVIERPGGARVLVLETRRLLEGALARATVEGETPGWARGERSAVDAAAEREGETDETQLVSFEVEGQEYALDISRVKEIVTLPSELVQVPKSSAEVAGLMVLRDRNLPLVDLRRLLGLPRAAPEDGRRVVVATGFETPEVEVGVVVDTVREVLRLPASAVDEVPPLLRSGESSELAGVCRLDGGKRIVTLLDVDQLIDTSALQRVANEGGDEMQAQVRDAGREGDDAEEQFVVFRLEAERYGIPVEAVQEIVRVPETITAVPKAPAWVEGIINLRGEVLPVIDQRARFGLESVERCDRQRIVVLKLRGQLLGFVVDAVAEVRKIPQRAIGPSPALSDEQADLIRRVANLGADRGIILLLEPEQMMSGIDAQALASWDAQSAA